VREDGRLIDLRVDPEAANELRAESRRWPSWTLSPRQLADLELLVDGSFAPLTGFLGAADHAAVVASQQLADGTPWPVPITLDVTADVADQVETTGHLNLRDPEGVLLAVLDLADRFQPDLEAEADALHGTHDPNHPAVDDLLRHTHADRLGGRVAGIETVTHWDFRGRRLTPSDVRARLADTSCERVVGFATGDPLHPADVERLRAAAADGSGGADAMALVVLGLIGPSPRGGLDPYTLVRCWEAVVDRLPPRTVLAVTPMAADRGGRRQPALVDRVLRNHGATDAMAATDEEAADDDLIRRLDRGDALPPDTTFPEVEAELRRSYPPRSSRGFTVFMTGLSGSGKSTVAQALAARLRERGDRHVALLDGDRVRLHLSSELGFSRHDRDVNIRRIGFVAAEITRAGGIALCAPIAPYDAVRRDVRAMYGERGGFVLVHISTPLETCEARDRKGLYAKARAGEIAEFTGISDPYEAPDDADLAVDTSTLTVDQAVDRIVDHLRAEGYLEPDA
jgi:sulfate adenylyltransferase